MAECNLEQIIKSCVDKALNNPIMNGKSITQWAAIGMKAPHWISVKDNPPDGECIAYSEKWDEMIIGYIYKTEESDTGYEAENEQDFLRDVSHWMPKPISPKEVNNG